MSYILIILFFLALFHFIYSGILLPCYRFDLRLQLFELRDRLRNIYIQDLNIVECNEEAFHFLHDGINNFINRIHLLTPSLKVYFEEEYQNNEELKKRVEKRREIIENCESSDFKEIFKEANAVLEKAFIANSGGWFVYLIPIIIFASSISKISRLTTEMIATTNNDASKLMRRSEAIESAV